MLNLNPAPHDGDSEPPAPATETEETNAAGSNTSVALLALLLFAFWVALSGKFDAFHLGMGFVSAVGVAIATRRLYLLPPAPMPAGEFPRTALRLHRFFGYAIWLVIQIFRSAGSIARLVLHPRLPANPRLVRIEDGLPHGLARLTLAHSITLTPGTVTVECDDGGMVIHAIDEHAAASLGRSGGNMAERVHRLFPRVTT